MGRGVAPFNIPDHYGHQTLFFNICGNCFISIFYISQII